MIPKNLIKGFLSQRNGLSRVSRKMSSSSPADSELLIDIQNKVAVVTLNRPKAMNALSLSMIRTFYPRFEILVFIFVDIANCRVAEQDAGSGSGFFSQFFMYNNFILF
jgi:hypothetical protein